MFCAQCGAGIADDSRFCRHCGAAQSGDSPSIETPPAPFVARSVNPVGRMVGIAAAAILGLVLIIGLMDGPASPEASAIQNNADMLADRMEMQADNLQAIADRVTADAEPIAETTGPWSYSQDEDKVRGGTSYFASTTSTNTIHQDPPYDAATTMRMTVRRMPSSGTDVVLTISSGQMMCPSYDGCSGTVRFDDGPAERVTFNGPADNSSDTIFVVGAKSFIAKLRKARKVVVEKTLYEAGEPQFEFDVSGLKWDH